MDGTPVVDIKPYLPYADAVPGAKGGFAAASPPLLPVEFTAEADAQLAAIGSKHPDVKGLAVQVLQQDPRPTYFKRGAEDSQESYLGKEHCQHLCDVRFGWRTIRDDAGETKVVVHDCRKLPEEEVAVMYR